MILQYGMIWGPFGPLVDGEGGILPKTPKEQSKVFELANQMLFYNIIAGFLVVIVSVICSMA